MTQADRRYDRLAVRLSLIISRLLAGETLSVRKLAAEFGVSTRTLRRDFRERLMYLDLEYRNGLCRLPEHHNPARHGQDVLMFVRQTGMENVFPGLDNRLVNTLLDSGEDAPCLVWHPPLRGTPTLPGHFYRLTRAIGEQLRVTILADGQRYDGLSPYRLICLYGEWYLVAESLGHLLVLPLHEIHGVTVSTESFLRRDDICHLTTQSDFITALPHFRFIHDVLTTFGTSLTT
ncbi:DeoR family transcriptional regulator [Pectobacterium araliae]|uniref:DeoR family transcriptional regulator n=2 Tax=Pectobacterium TaxID=122277 RepID=A0AAN0KK10_9GAMM|nr:DeoR family transcriptional regulator [Pectobacterium sp. MAFF 302110]